MVPLIAGLPDDSSEPVLPEGVVTVDLHDTGRKVKIS
jgi:hypothetical protein